MNRGSLEIFIGTNGSGKTTELTRLYEISKKHNGQNSKFWSTSESIGEQVSVKKDSSKLMELIKASIKDDPAISEIEQTLKTLKKQINENLKSLSNEFIGSVLNDILKIKLENPLLKEIESIDIDNLNLKSLIQLDSKLSDGTINYLTIIMMSRMSLVDGKFTLKELFLDEPDAFLHPSAFKVLSAAINDLLNSGCNIYIATHNPQFISELNLDFNNVTIFDKKHSKNKINLNSIFDEIQMETKKISSTKYKELFKVDNFKKLFNKHFKYTLLPSLFSDFVLLCEGINDKIYLNEIVNKIVPTYSLNVVSTFGKPMLYIWDKILKKVNINHITLFDWDMSKIGDSIILSKLLEKCENSIYFKEDLEKSIGISAGIKFEWESCLPFIEQVVKSGENIEVKSHISFIENRIKLI